MVGNKFQVLRQAKRRRKDTKQGRNRDELILILQLLILINLFYMATVHKLQDLPQTQY